MIFEMNEKWRNSSIFTKIPMFAMALDVLLLLICSITFFALGGGAKGYGVLWLILFLYNAVLAFGLFKVNRVARIAVIYGGLAIILPYILMTVLFIFSLIRFPLLKKLLSLYMGLLKNVYPLMKSFVPGEAKAALTFLMTIFIGPMILNVFAMLILFFRGKDFKYGEAAKKSKLVAYLLWFFLGFFSAHKFYLEKDGVGIVFFLTFQIFWFGWFINLFTLGKQVDAYNAKLAESTNK
jgi:TM2 domain-containing membrane protein YozV